MSDGKKINNNKLREKIMNKKKLSLMLLFVLNNNYLRDKGESTFEKRAEPFELASKESNEQANNYEEEDDEIKNNFTSDEIEEFKKSLQDRLKIIDSNKDKKHNNEEIKLLKTIEYIKETRLALFELKHNAHVVNIINIDEINTLPLKNFRTRLTSNASQRAIKFYQGHWLSIIASLVEEKIQCSQEEIKLVKNNSIKDKYLTEYEKLASSISEFIEFDTTEKINEKNWFDLWSWKNIDRGDLSNALLDNLICSKEEKKFLSLTDIDKVMTNKIFRGTQVKNENIINKNAIFKNIKAIHDMANDLALYEEYIKDKQFSIKEFIKFLEKEKVNESKDVDYLNKLDNQSLINKIASFKIGMNGVAEISKQFGTFLIQTKKGLKMDINLQNEMGVTSLNEIQRDIRKKKLDYIIDINNFYNMILLFHIQKKDNDIEGKAFKSFKNDRKNQPKKKFLTIDKQLSFIEKSLFKMKFIVVEKSKLSINPSYLNMIRPKIEQYNAIKQNLIQCNTGGLFNRFLNLMHNRFLSDISEGYFVQAVIISDGNEIFPNMISEDIRNFAGKFIKNNLPQKYDVKINPDVEKIKLNNYKILPLEFDQFDTKDSPIILENNTSSLTAESGSGKSLLARSIIAGLMTAKVFNNVPFMELEISPHLNLQDLLVGMIQNQGEKNKLSNYETNSDMIRKLMKFIHSQKKPAIMFFDETLSGTTSRSGANMINKNQEIKDLFHEGLLTLVPIEHSEETRMLISDQEIFLLPSLVSIGKKKPNINQELYEKSFLFKTENPEVFEQILKGAIALKQANLYFEVDQTNQKLRLIDEPTYTQLHDHSAGSVTKCTYIPQLNNTQNINDRSGNITYDVSDKKLIFNRMTHLFDYDGNYYMAIIGIKPQYGKNGEIVYEIEKTIDFYDRNHLILKNDKIITVKKKVNQSYEALPPFLLISKDSKLNQVLTEKGEERRMRRIDAANDEKLEDSEVVITNLEK